MALSNKIIVTECACTGNAVAVAVRERESACYTVQEE